MSSSIGNPRKSGHLKAQMPRIESVNGKRLSVEPGESVDQTVNDGMPSSPARDSTTLDLDSIRLIGTSFRTSPVGFREEVSKLISKQGGRPGLKRVREYVFVETCNRIELYWVQEAGGARGSRSQVDVPVWFSSNPSSFYLLKGKDAILHLFELAAGLDSLVVGEEQILSQLRAAGIRARVSGSSRAILSMLFDVAVRVGFRARALYRAAGTSRSLSSIALDFILKKFDGLPQRVLLIGTGETIRLAAAKLVGGRVFVATRRREVPSYLNGATRIPYDDIGRFVAGGCDLVIAGTTYRDGGYILDRDLLAGLDAASNDRRMVILDLAFPRNVDPTLRGLPNIDLYDLDDLAKLVGSDVRDGPAYAEVRRLLEREADKFARQLKADRLSPALAQVYRWAEDIRSAEVKRTLGKLHDLSSDESMEVEVMSSRLVGKLLAPLASFVKGNSKGLSQEERLAIFEAIIKGELS